MHEKFIGKSRLHEKFIGKSRLHEKFIGIKKVYRNQEDVAGILDSEIGPGNPPIGRTDILPYVLISSFLDFKDL